MVRSDEAGQGTGDIAIVGAGPAGLVTAIALARRGVRTTVFERDVHPDQAPRFNPDRSYTIDITGHGLRALRYLDATSYFDERMLAFKGIQYHGRVLEGWDEPGWTGSRGEIVRTLMAVVTDRHEGDVDFRFESPVQSVDVHTGTLTYARAAAARRSGSPTSSSARTAPVRPFGDWPRRQRGDGGRHGARRLHRRRGHGSARRRRPLRRGLEA